MSKKSSSTRLAGGSDRCQQVAPRRYPYQRDISVPCSASRRSSCQPSAAPTGSAAQGHHRRETVSLKISEIYADLCLPAVPPAVPAAADAPAPTGSTVSLEVQHQRGKTSALSPFTNADLCPPAAPPATPAAADSSAPTGSAARHCWAAASRSRSAPAPSACLRQVQQQQGFAYSNGNEVTRR